MNGAVILHLHIFHVSGELADVAGDGEAAGTLHGTAHVNGACDGRVAGNLALEVGANQRIKIEPQELDGDMTGPVTAKVDVAVKVEFSFGEIRTPAQNNVFAVGLGQHGHAAHHLAV